MGETVDRNNDSIRIASSEQLRRDPNKNRIAITRLDIPASKKTLDLQFLVNEEREICNRFGVRFFQGEFLARLAREGVKSVVLEYPEHATPVMQEIAHSEPITTYLRRRKVILPMANLPDPDAVIPDIVRYQEKRFNGHSLKSAFSRNLITGRDILAIHISARMLEVEIRHDPDLFGIVSYFIQKMPGINLKLKLLAQETERLATQDAH